MLSHEGGAVCTTGVFNVAVALATFGYPYRLERLRDEPTGDVVSCLWHIHPDPVLYEKASPDENMPAVRAPTLLRALKTGTLQISDPEHPVLDVLHALNIFERLRTYMERGTRYRIAAAGVGRATLVEGQEPAADAPRPAIRTNSIDLATALVRRGIPVLGCEGTAPRRVLVLGAQGYELGTAPADAMALANGINSGELRRSQPDDPALWALVGLQNRRAMKAEMDRATIPLLLRNPRSLAWERRRKSVIVPGTATGSDLDRARAGI